MTDPTRPDPIDDPLLEYLFAEEQARQSHADVVLDLRHGDPSPGSVDLDRLAGVIRRAATIEFDLDGFAVAVADVLELGGDDRRRFLERCGTPEVSR